MLSAGVDTLNYSMQNDYIGRSTFICVITYLAYFFLHSFLPLLFALYLMNITGAAQKAGKPFYIVFMTPLFISELLVISSPITKLVFYFDDKGVYHRGSLMSVIYIVAGIYIGAAVLFFIIHRTLLSRLNRATVIIVLFIAASGMIVQGIFSINIELFFESTGLLLFLLLLEEGDAREKRGKLSRISKSFVAVISLIFMMVISINITLIFQVGAGQTEKIGEIQLSNIKGDLQQNISEDESSLLHFSMGLEQMINSKAGTEKLEKYIKEQKDYYEGFSGGNCFSVYAVSPRWTLKPDSEVPEDIDPLKSPWYTGAKQNPGEICITDPYVDSDTGNLCLTFSYCLADGKTVAGMDYALDGIQDTIESMSTEVDQFAMIVTDSGMIVGCSENDCRGKSLAVEHPDYSEVYYRVKASKEHKSFHANIDDSGKIIFSSETDNGWQLILAVDDNIFYAETINQMILLGAIDFMMIAVIIAFYLLSVNNRDKAVNALNSAETLIAGISGDIRVPLQDIMTISESTLGLDYQAQELALLGVHEAGERLQEQLDDLFSYSNITKEKLKKQQESDAEKRRERDRSAVSSRRTRNGITGILIATLLTGLVLCLVVANRWGKEKISRDADNYSNEVTVWMEQKQSLLSMWAEVISVDSKRMDSYPALVKWLNDIVKEYDEITFAYVANPANKKHPIILNNGYVPGSDYKVEERQWYIEAKSSEDGHSISPPYYDDQTGLYCITFSRCIYSKKGDFIGVLAIDCLLDNLIGILDDSYSDDGYAFMADPDGVIINHPNKEYEISSENSVSIEDTEYAGLFHNGDKFGMWDYDGRLVAGHSVKNELSGLTVLVAESWWSIYGVILVVSFIFLIMIIVSIVGVVGMINRFIKWQTDAAEQLIIAADKADAAARAKSTFLAQMSHEIRTPINAVLGMNEMILRESTESKILGYADNIRISGKNLLSLINSILDYSKIEEGKMEIVPVRYETVSLIKNIETSVIQRAESKGLVFETHVASELPRVLYGDDMCIARVAVNLLTNAVKYTEEGRVDLYFDWVKKPNGTYRLKITVKDTGIGIKEEDQEKLFDSFTRLDEMRNHSIEGTGLGMAIVNSLLGLMDGTLEVHSVYGEGSTFSFEVEQNIIDNNGIGDYADLIAREQEDENNDKQFYTYGVKLLIVDDNDMNLKVAVNLLNLIGITPDQASSGQMAIELMEKNTYDIIMLDHMMPGMDGIDTLQEAKERKLIADGCVVIVLTANAVTGAKEEYIKAGFDDYLTKPLEMGALEQALKKYLPPEKIEYRDIDISKKSIEDSSAGADADDDYMEFMPGEYDTVSIEDNSELFSELDDKGIDTRTALSYFGGDEKFYKETLATFYATAVSRTDELTEELDKRDMKGYAVNVHALKSNAKTLGANSLFEIALSLEKAAKSGDDETVKNDHPALIQEVENVVSIIGDTPLADMDVSAVLSADASNDEVIEFIPE
ncbi:MAG: response regulator [Eubacterium sp.]|nr:response regulator [Eubacterium sp.]